jgi:hypothetical protein
MCEERPNMHIPSRTVSDQACVCVCVCVCVYRHIHYMKENISPIEDAANGHMASRYGRKSANTADQQLQTAEKWWSSRLGDEHKVKNIHR